MSKCIERPRTTCAQGGALATISALPKVIALSHAAEGCAGNLMTAIAAGSGFSGEGYCSGTQIPSSAIREKHVVFGGAERLTEQIRSADELMDADLFVVVSGCMTELIGDDIQSVVQNLKEIQTPVIAVNTPSFSGDAYVGYELVMDGIFNKYLEPTEEKNEKLVNIFGVVPFFDPFFRGDLTEIKRILEKLGLTVNTFFTPDQTFENIKSAPKAALNIIFSNVWGTEFVKKFKNIHGTEYLQADLPIGAYATEQFLRKLADHFPIDRELLEKVIREEAYIYYEYFTRSVDVITNSQYFFYGTTITNSNYAIPLSYYLSVELGWQVDEVVVTDILSKNREKNIKEAFEKSDLKGELILETDAKQIEWKLSGKHTRNNGERYYDSHLPYYILGSSIDKYAAANLGASTLAISYPVNNRLITNRGYAGYNGGLCLLEDIIGVLLGGR